ncbi:hypothetical protein TUM4438_43530 [Shewanella sairae]|uniref:Uncharacterized protein n=1 Tax=Shewanella sairae TaxID=190310 RepID=A0ABQ4PR77_9GAMM|nr:hypothetical protein [Shewanella sairae]MCL1132465.1 hypothetical protein [Shewanella sairae]GIU52009.1 hypothetical protein TUM4438_43530 [Shewanella sairae]
MIDLWNKLEENPRFFTFFWGAAGSLAVWLIVEHSGTILLYLGSGALSSLTDYVDSRYEKAAMLQPTNYSYYILTLFFVAVTVIWAGTSSRMNLNKPKEKETSNSNKPIPKWAPFLVAFINIIVWFWLSFVLLFLAGESMVLNATSDYTQHMRIIAPYIDSQKEENILSSWSQMNSIDDYNKIYLELNEIAKENNIVLKRNRQY